MVVGVDMVVLSEHIGSNRMKKKNNEKKPSALEVRRGVIPCSRGNVIVVVPCCPLLSCIVVGESGDVAV